LKLVVDQNPVLVIVDGGSKMESFFGVIYGIVAGCIGAFIVMVMWAIGGILREYVLGCLGGFLTFVIIELPIWVGYPFTLAEPLVRYSPNPTGGKAALVVYVVAIIVLISNDTVRKIRVFIQTNLLRR
jgi:hypothetical protein